MTKYFYTLLALCLVLASCNEKKENATDKVAESEASVKDLPWQKIEPTEIEGNAVKMFADDWFELAAGQEGDMNLMTIA